MALKGAQWLSGWARAAISLAVNYQIVTIFLGWRMAPVGADRHD
jgi:hypothetical protein